MHDATHGMCAHTDYMHILWLVFKDSVHSWLGDAIAVHVIGAIATRVVPFASYVWPSGYFCAG